MTIDEAIKEFQHIKRQRAKELKEQNPGMDSKELNKRAGRLSLYMQTRPGYVAEAYLSTELFTIAHDYYSTRGVKVFVEQ